MKIDSDYAPWYIVPADDKENARLIVSRDTKNAMLLIAVYGMINLTRESPSGDDLPVFEKAFS